MTLLHSILPIMYFCTRHVPKAAFTLRDVELGIASAISDGSITSSVYFSIEDDRVNAGKQQLPAIKPRLRWASCESIDLESFKVDVNQAETISSRFAGKLSIFRPWFIVSTPVNRP